MPLCPQEAADGSGSSRDSPVDPRMWIILETCSPKISWCCVCFFMCETIRSMCLWLWCQQDCHKWTKYLQCFALRRHTGSYEQSSFAHELARRTCSCRRLRWARRPSSGKASEDSSCGREGIGSRYEGGTTPVSSCVEHSLLWFHLLILSKSVPPLVLVFDLSNQESSSIQNIWYASGSSNCMA